MKNILISLFMFIANILIGQMVDYPVYYTDPNGQKVVMLTIEQAQILDNNTDLLVLFQKMDTEIINVDSACRKSLSDMSIVVSNLEKSLSTQRDLIKNKDEQIENQNFQIKDYKMIGDNYVKEIENKNKEINLHLDEIKRQKGRVIIGTGIGIIVGFLSAVIILH